MNQGITRRGLALTALAMPAIRRARADDPLRLRVTLDSAPSHTRNVAFADFLGKLEVAAGGRIKPELFASGQLFADLDVGKALIQGQVEMACPGLWTQTGFVPDGDYCQLPAMYGRSLSEAHAANDHQAGAKVNGELETKLRAHVLGPWLDLGYQHWFTTRTPINSLTDFKGLKIRSPGGAGIAWRIRHVGAIANTTPYPQVPLALSQGTFDGLISTNISLASLQIWESGVKYAYEDRQFIGEYVPLVSNAFWARLDPGLQRVMTDLWRENNAAYRAHAEGEQIKSRELLQSHGISFVIATPEQLAASRAEMMTQQTEMAREIKVSPDLVGLVMQDLGAAA